MHDSLNIHDFMKIIQFFTHELDWRRQRNGAQLKIPFDSSAARLRQFRVVTVFYKF